MDNAYFLPRAMIRLFLLGLAALCLVACNPQPQSAPEPLSAPGPPPPPSGAFLAQLAPDQVAQLNQLPIDIVVPGFIPSDFAVATIQTGPANSPQYVIAYRNRQDSCFAIEFSSNPDTLPAAQQSLPVSPPLFTANTYSLHYSPESPAANPLFSDWMQGSSGFYRLIGSPYINSLPGLSDCKNIPPETAVQVIESLTVINPESIGEGKAVK